MDTRTPGGRRAVPKRRLISGIGLLIGSLIALVLVTQPFAPAKASTQIVAGTFTGPSN
jgi:hypothetical protein